MSSDGESDPPSSDGVQSPVKVRLRSKKISTEVHTRTHTLTHELTHTRTHTLSHIHSALPWRPLPSFMFEAPTRLQILMDLMVLVVLMALVDPGPLSSSAVVFQDINKRLSLPADIRLPDGYLEKFNVIGPSLFEQPISRRLHRVSLVCPSVSVGLCLFGHLLPVL